MSLLKTFEKEGIDKKEFEYILYILKDEKKSIESLEKKYELTNSLIEVLEQASEGGDLRAFETLEKINSDKNEVDKVRKETLNHLDLINSILSKIDIL